MLDKTYEKVKEKLKKKLKSVMNCELPRISFETDIWTSKNTADSYCALIAHFIDDDFKKHVLLLSVSDFEGKHTSTNMKSWFHEQFLDFGIPSDMKDTATLKKSVFAIVADNESAVQKAVKELQKAGLGLVMCLFREWYEMGFTFYCFHLAHSDDESDHHAIYGCSCRRYL